MNTKNNIRCYECDEEIKVRKRNTDNTCNQLESERIYMCRQCAFEIREKVPVAQIKDYHIIKLLGKGPHGETYLAWDETNGKVVALKHTNNIPYYNSLCYPKINDEISALKSISHPSVLQLNDWGGTEEGHYCFVSSYMMEGNLKEYIQSVRDLNDENAEESNLRGMQELCATVIDILSGLSYLHKKGCVHGNITLGNILVGRDVEEEIIIKLGDFQFSKSYLLSEPIVNSSFPEKVIFCPSEQLVNSSNIGPITDLYAVGMCMYNIITNRFPYDFSDKKRTPSKIILGDDKPELVDNMINDIPRHLARTINRAIDKDISKRFQSADEFKKEIEICLDYLHYVQYKAHRLMENYQRCQNM
jgi:serine/threonine protein kinase